MLSNQLILPLMVNTQLNFANFYCHSNQQLFFLLQDLNNIKQSTLIYCFGQSGAGKSHLMFAFISKAIQLNQPSAYLNARHQTINNEVLEGLPFSGVIVLEDIDFIAQQKEKEQIIFAIYEKVKSEGGCLVVTANKPANQCDFELPDLLSRLQSDLSFQVHSLDDEARAQAITLRAKQRGMSISSKALSYFLNHASRDNHVLFKLFDKIDKTSLIEKRQITIPFIKQLLENRKMEKND